ncbi:hypothetical protein ABG79_00474 [Caloramator mitchellensis]|uniref:DUF4129 domain-containing protein n=1 Tax=Caloramator mitchellensis TaxID=908809 RepID=A0A0R3JVQ6_CALMK|nr:hypothetical protein [Caloramator mitchellensis]KRQ87673.1 hypothetical protein ABG79_00474 [Caloramator mitchellensis]
MRYVYLLNRLSLLYMTFNTISIILSRSIGQVQFFYYIIALFISEIAIKKYGKNIFFIALLFIPAISSKSFFEALIFIILSFLMTKIQKEEMTSYSLFTEKFENGIKMISGIVAVFLITFSFNILNSFISGFIIVYLTTGTILLRTLRYEETEKKAKRPSRYNMFFNLSIIFLSIILSIEGFRRYLLISLTFIYNKFIDLFFYLFYWLFFVIAILLEQVRRLLYRAISSENINIITQKMGSEDAKKVAQDVMQNTTVNFALAFTAKILVFALFMYIIYKLILKENKVDFSNSQIYREEREFLFDSNKKYINKLSSFLKPRNNNELIRYYYSKYISKLKRSIEIMPYDTSLSIKSKSDNFVDKEKNAIIREIYIKARYGFENISDLEKNLFVNLVKEFKIVKSK